MKKNVLIGCIVLLVVSTIILFIPKRIHKYIEGVIYELGVEKTQDDYKPVKISIVGNYSKGFPFKHSFRGTIAIGELYLNDNVNILFDENNKAYLSDTYYDATLNRLITDTFGVIYIDKGFRSISINVMDQLSGGWDSEFGTIISAPATTKEEAIKISEKLMEYKLSD